jgi:hypothetical protein
VIRKLLALIILLAVFTGGYQLGRLPDSPDLVGHAQATWSEAVHIGSSVASAVENLGQALGLISEPAPESPEPTAEATQRADARGADQAD